jgi:hypothetical protein
MPHATRLPIWLLIGLVALAGCNGRQASSSTAIEKIKRTIANRDYDLAVSLASDALSEDVRGRNYAELMMLRAEAKYLRGNFSEASLTEAWKDTAAAVGAAPDDARTHYQWAFIAHSLADRVVAGQALLDLKWLRAEEEQHLIEAVRLDPAMRARAHDMMPDKF